MLDKPLMRLLIQAGLLSTWDREFWFRDCTLQGAVIGVPTEELARSIRRCYLPQMQAVRSDLEVRVVIVVPVTKKTAYKGQAVEVKNGRLDY